MKATVKPFLGQVTLDGCQRLLDSPWHEARTAALILLLHEAELAAKECDISRLDAIEAFRRPPRPGEQLGPGVHLRSRHHGGGLEQAERQADRDPQASGRMWPTAGSRARNGLSFGNWK